MRGVKTTLNDILSLVSVAEDYGFKDDVLFNAFADIIDRKLSIDEIKEYANLILNDEDYGQEDYDSIKEALTEFKVNYCV